MHRQTYDIQTYRRIRITSLARLYYSLISPPRGRENGERASASGGFKAESLLGHITRKASPPFSLPSSVVPYPLSSPPLPSPPSPPLPQHPLPFSLPSLRSRLPQIQLGVWERCKLPQRGLGQSPSRNRIWCI